MIFDLVFVRFIAIFVQFIAIFPLNFCFQYTQCWPASFVAVHVTNIYNMC